MSLEAAFLCFSTIGHAERRWYDHWLYYSDVCYSLSNRHVRRSHTVKCCNMLYYNYTIHFLRCLRVLFKCLVVFVPMWGWSRVYRIPLPSVESPVLGKTAHRSEDRWAPHVACFSYGHMGTAASTLHCRHVESYTAWNWNSTKLGVNTSFLAPGSVSLLLPDYKFPNCPPNCPLCHLDLSGLSDRLREWRVVEWAVGSTSTCSVNLRFAR